MPVALPTPPTAPRSRRLALRGAAIALLSLLVLLVVGPPAATARGAVTIEDGWIDWGVKQSFREYVEGPIAVGRIDTDDGASRNDDGTFRFPVTGGTHDPDRPEADATAAGTVHFRGHGGGDEWLLDLRMWDPRLLVEGGQGTLLLDVRSRRREDPDQYYEGSDIPFAVVDLADATITRDGDTTTYADMAATLTEEGAEAFDGNYEEGEELDPLTLVAVSQPGAPSTSGAASTADGDDTEGTAPHGAQAESAATTGTSSAAAPEDDRGTLPDTGGAGLGLLGGALMVLAAVLATTRRVPVRQR